MPRQLGLFNALRAALTAVSTSLTDAACTDVIMDSSLYVGYVLISKSIFEEKLPEKLPENAWRIVIHETYVGLVLTIFPPSEDLTHSLLMNRPVGWVYFRPLGAISSTERSDIFSSFRLVFDCSLGRLISLVSRSKKLAFLRQS